MDPAEQGVYIGLSMGGRYRIEQHLGSGNFSGVFRAIDNQTGAPVAVKILSFLSSNSPDAKFEFAREIELLTILAGCSHVVDILDHGTQGVTLTASTGTPLSVPVDFLVLELADVTLAEILLARHRLPWEDRLLLFRDVVKGMHQAHLNSIVHRDLKSDNTLVYASPQAAKIADFGRSRDISKAAAFIDDAYVGGRGDLRFAPPECIWLCGSSDPDEMARADLYLLGSILFELATGVGMTSLVLPDSSVILNSMVPLSEAQRKSELAARLPDLRARCIPVYELFASQLALDLRGPTVTLLKLLTDPDPAARLPGFRRKTLTPWDLGWLIARVDVLLKVAGYSKLARPRRPKGLEHR